MPPQLVTLHSLDPQRLAAEAAQGLLRPQAALPPKFFYDALGSRLFDAITLLPEYDLTRNEAALFATHRSAIAAAVGAAGATLVDVGAGSGAKAAAWFAALGTRRYLALDISCDFLAGALDALAGAHPQVAMCGVGLDFTAALALPPELLSGPALVFYPGSSIGNFAPAEALALLVQMRQLAGPGGALLIGVDLLKPVAEMEAAYDDALGLTAAFNRNLLAHLNRLLGSDFAPRQWRHRAVWNAATQAVEMHLHAREALTVRWPGAERRFAAGEGIHTENAHKWRVEAFAALLRRAGFEAVQTWTDAGERFAVMVGR
ncbi:MAG: L-histidine N(alpha)-methyltransferase [Proteobacteria bacterium]|nr:L-histidine N(alpha)-methyltransferase [Pseudomonadota bacterium]